MELLKRAWTILRRRWLIVLASLAIAVVATAVLNVTSDKTYTASTEIFLRAPDIKTSAGAYQGDLFSRQRAQTYVNVFRSDELAQMVIDKLGLPMTPQQLVPRVSATAVKNTVLIVVSVVDSDPQRAANISNEYGAVLGTYVAKLENVSNDPNVPPLVEVITKASPASAKPSGFPITMIAIGAFVVALLAAFGLIFFLERFDQKIKSRREVEKISGADIVGKLPDVSQLGSNGNVVKAFDQSAKFSQAALRLSLNVESMLQRLPKVEIPPVVAVVASSADDEATIATRALAQALAHRGRTVGLIRFSARRQQSELVKPVSASVAADESAGAAVAEAEDRVDPVKIVSCPSAGLSAETLSREIDALRPTNDVILIDTPAFSTSINSQLAVGAADAAILVVRPLVTTTIALAEAVAGMRVLDTPTLGVVANLAKESSTLDGYYL